MLRRLLTISFCIGLIIGVLIGQAGKLQLNNQNEVLRVENIRLFDENTALQEDLEESNRVFNAQAEEIWRGRNLK